MRNLFILRGVPACGKSTWIEENGYKHYTLSSDDLRLYLKKDTFSQVMAAVKDASSPVADRTPVMLMDQ